MGSRRRAYIENNNLRIVVAIQVKTTTDRNGNSQRAWVLVNGTPLAIAPLTLSGNIITVLKDVGTGRQIVDVFVKKTMQPWYETLVVIGPSFPISPMTYCDLVKRNVGFERAAMPRDWQESEDASIARLARSNARTVRVRRIKES